jgi:hypothetical protein
MILGELSIFAMEANAASHHDIFENNCMKYIALDKKVRPRRLGDST